MEAEELMIGDWVQATPLYPILGERMPPTNVKVDADILVNTSWELTSIPITPEILEKNGFEAFDDTYYCLRYNGQTISYSLGNNELAITSIYIQFDGNIDYVHELQHALKLCKVDKEIIL